MNQDVPNSYNALPWDLGMSLFEIAGDASSRLTYDLNQPNRAMLKQSIMLKCLKSDAIR